MIGSFAGITFSVSEQQVRNFLNLTRETSARFAAHEVIGGKPKQEFLGPGLATGSFTMELNAMQGVKPMEAIHALARFVEAGQTAYFILGGRSLGRYVVTDMGEAYEIISQAGKVVKAKVDVSMEEYQ